ncbi:MAG: vitamin K epoxide reductase family protein [bacterium]|nr:vitamin K epoxide reductase family protein [bacterium]
MRKLLIIIAIAALFGIADSAYLSYAALRDLPLPCTLLDGCNEVARSPYSKVFGVPLALYGLLFYAAVGGLALAALASPRRVLLSLIKFFALLGFLLSIYFTYLQAVKINAFCIYCLASAAFATIIFACSLFLKAPETPAAPPNSPVI